MKSYLSSIILVLITFSIYSQGISEQSKHYVFPEFKAGYILLKDGTKKSGILNYNALTENFAIKNNDEILGLSKKDGVNVDTVYVGNVKFIKRDGKFFQLLLNSNVELYLEYKCNLSTATEGRNAYGGSSQTTSSTAISSLDVQGNRYALELPKLYKISLVMDYWIKKDNALTKIATLGQLKKLYKDRKKDIKAYRKTQKVDFKIPESVSNLVKFLETSHKE